MTLGLGLWLLPRATPFATLLVWDGLVGAFVAMRIVGLMANAHREDAVPLTRLLHLPLTLRSVFVLNFALSEVKLANVAFLPALLGLAVASTATVDVAAAVLVPGTLALGLCVAAVVHQFRTWSMSAVVPGRRRLPIGMLLLFACVLAINGLNLAVLSNSGHHHDAEPGGVHEAQSPDATRSTEQLHRFEENVRLANVLLPPGWIALGAEGVARGTVWPGLLSAVGLSIIAGLSLRSSYRATLALYRGSGSSSPAGLRRRRRYRGMRVREPRDVPLALAIARSAWRVWIRSARGKLTFFAPVYAAMLAGFATVGFPALLAPDSRPLTAVGLVGVANFTMTALACNFFGLDGGAFRLFMVAPASRYALLAGKHLAALPLYALSACAVLVYLQAVAPLGIGHLAGVCLQGGVIFALSSVVGGKLSMSMAYAVLPASFTSPKSGTANLLGMLAMLAVAATVTAAAAGALAVERLIGEAIEGFPAFALLSAAELAAAVWIWRLAVRRQATRLTRLGSSIEERVAGSQ